MIDDIKLFIQRHIDLIDSEDFHKVYALADTEIFSLIGEFTQVLFEADINPLKFLNFVPYGFLRDAKLTNTNLVIPSHIKFIEGNAFKNSNIRNVVIEPGCQGIDKYAFRECYDLQHVALPYTIRAIGFSCFLRTPNLKTITYDGTYAEFRHIALDDTEKDSWFGPAATLGNTNCILICKDKKVPLHLEF